jgi:mRNA-degrading endonuclease HigB of HigAB toxin-antitoxin module
MECRAPIDLRQARAGESKLSRSLDRMIRHHLGGNYRLITRVNYEGKRLYVKALLTHTEYDPKEWLKWA